jgi:hypothetical protein
VRSASGRSSCGEWFRVEHGYGRRALRPIDHGGRAEGAVRDRAGGASQRERRGRPGCFLGTRLLGQETAALGVRGSPGDGCVTHRLPTGGHASDRPDSVWNRVRIEARLR